MDDFPPRPPTPQVLLHRLPDKPDDADSTRRPSKYIILIMAPTAVAGKVQIATSVAQALECPLFQGDSLHESSAKAASVGANRPARPTASGAASTSNTEAPGPNETRYRRMWLSKLTRTGLLFPEESRPATEGFTGFGGPSSTSTSRRGSVSSAASEGWSSAASHSRGGSMDLPPQPPPLLSSTFALRPVTTVQNTVFTVPEAERRRRARTALMVLTHPGLERWHKVAIRSAVGEYGIGVIFVPLYDEAMMEEGGESDDEEEGLPVLRPLDPRTMTSFPVSFGALAKKARPRASLDREMKLRIDVNADVEGKIAEIIAGVKDIMAADEE